MKVRWLNKALDNLNAEAEYLAQEDPNLASQIIQRIVNCINLLENNPALGRQSHMHDVRELIVPDTRYIVPYRVKSKEEVIEILRIFHTSRKTPKRW